MEEMMLALRHEVVLRANQIKNEPIETIYFGGGTPSLASTKSLSQLLETCYDYFLVSPEAEITIEANPEDVNKDSVKEWLNIGINRVSIGIQSFYAEDLLWMNRAHDENMAIRALETIFEAGFINVSIDLIFGYPLLSNVKWLHNIHLATSFPITHISCYGMTVEPKTALYHQINKGQIQPLSDDIAAEQYLSLIKTLKTKGFEHYEISNFGKPKFHSKHNSAYWNGNNFLGIGPSAHGYIKPVRYWNIRQNAAYIRAIKENSLPEERETLTVKDQINEFIMTGLRQRRGLSTLQLNQNFDKRFAASIIKNAQNWIHSGHLLHQNNSLILSENGLLLADKIMSDLFIVDIDI